MKQIIIESTIPIRLDRYLRRYYFSKISAPSNHNSKFKDKECANSGVGITVTQGEIEKLLRKGQIKVNGNNAKSSMRLVQGDVINISSHALLEKKDNIKNNKKYFSPSIIAFAKKIQSNYLLFSSDDLIAIDKPEGVAVQNGSKISLSVDDALQCINHTQNTNYKLVHRLDKATSGILLIAKDFDSAAKLGKAFSDKMIKKTYIAILSGCPESLKGKLVHQIGKDKSEFQIVRELSTGGKIAETDYKILKTINGLSLVEFRPITGRMHQLRFHSKILGCPIVGDNKYGGIKQSRMLLHAQNITIAASVFGKEITIESELPKEFELSVK